MKLAGGILSSTQARAIATAAQRYASGVLELTNRSNLQIRGVLPGQENDLIAALLAAGLGPRNPAADDVRNVLLSPAAGLDPQALLDVRPLAAQLLDLLHDDSTLHNLSPKFALQLDGGEALAMREHPHDIWLSAVAGDSTRLLFGLAGCPGDAPLAMVEVDQAPLLIAQLLHLFLDLATPQQVRMRQLLATHPATVVLERLQARLPFALQQPPQDWQPAASPARPPLGTYPQRQQGQCMAVAGARLGRLNAEQLLTLADLAERHADGDLHLTPWQGVLLGNIARENVDTLLQALAAIGLLTDSTEPLAGLIACTGASACARGLADTKGDVLLLAEHLRASGARPHVHLSACPRSCAAAHVTPYTLLASAPEHYQLYQREPGIAGFGNLLAPNMTLDEAGAWFAAHARAGRSDA